MFDDDNFDFDSIFCIFLILPLLIGWYFKLTFMLLEAVFKAVVFLIMGICYFVRFAVEIVVAVYHKILNCVAKGSE